MTYSLTGRQFGWLTVIKKLNRNAIGKTQWLCKCECGREKIYITNMLTGGKGAVTCGCCEDHIYRKEAYISWMSAKYRCLQPTNKDYAKYGGRGITFDPEWANDFKAFYRDMGDPPIWDGVRASLERNDVHKGYYKDNCCWANSSAQQNNKTNTPVKGKLENGDLQSK